MGGAILVLGSRKRDQRVGVARHCRPWAWPWMEKERVEARQLDEAAVGERPRRVAPAASAGGDARRLTSWLSMHGAAWMAALDESDYQAGATA